jgi:hypothetical protein
MQTSANREKKKRKERKNRIFFLLVVHVFVSKPSFCHSKVDLQFIPQSLLLFASPFGLLQGYCFLNSDERRRRPKKGSFHEIGLVGHLPVTPESEMNAVKNRKGVHHLRWPLSLSPAMCCWHQPTAATAVEGKMNEFWFQKKILAEKKSSWQKSVTTMDFVLKERVSSWLNWNVTVLLIWTDDFVPVLLLCVTFNFDLTMTMMRCDLDFLPEIIEQAKMLLGDYEESEVDESVR